MDPSKLFAGGGPAPGGAPAMPQISPEELAALGGMEGLRAKMSHLWSHLDQLAERSPEEYGQFLDKQARDAGVDAAAFQQFQWTAAGKGPAPGEGPGLVVLTRDEAGGGEVGICVWPRAEEEEEAGGAGGGAGPAPATVRGASLADLEAAGPAGRDYAGLVVPFHFGRAARSRPASPWLRGFAAPGAAVVDVECHGPSLAAVLAGGKELRTLFVELAFQSVEVEKGLRLSRRNRRLRTARPPPPRDVSQLASGTDLAARGVSDSLLGTLASLSSPGAGGAAAPGKGSGTRAAAKPKDEPAKKKVLIEEIAPEGAFRYTVKRTEGPAGGAGAWEVLVEVPGVGSVKDLVVEAAEAAVAVSRRGGGPGTEIALGAAIDSGSVRAKLDKKKHRLRITVAAKAE